MGTEIWIGATECAALLRFFGVKCTVVQFQSFSPPTITSTSSHNVTTGATSASSAVTTTCVKQQSNITSQYTSSSSSSVLGGSICLTDTSRVPPPQAASALNEDDSDFDWDLYILQNSCNRNSANDNSSSGSSNNNNNRNDNSSSSSSRHTTNVPIHIYDDEEERDCYTRAVSLKQARPHTTDSDLDDNSSSNGNDTADEDFLPSTATSSKTKQLIKNNCANNNQDSNIHSNKRIRKFPSYYHIGQNNDYLPNKTNQKINKWASNGPKNQNKNPFSKIVTELGRAIGDWVKQYFDTAASEKWDCVPPLYFQHDGHSRTIIGE